MNPTRPEIEQHIRDIAHVYGLPELYALKQCEVESSFDVNAVSPCNALGLFQLLPATAAELGVDPHDWKQNVKGGLKYMSQLWRLYKGDYAKALAAYNWGMGNLAKCIAKHGAAWREHLPAETQGYLKRILS